MNKDHNCQRSLFPLGIFYLTTYREARTGDGTFEPKQIDLRISPACIYRSILTDTPQTSWAVTDRGTPEKSRSGGSVDDFYLRNGHHSSHNDLYISH